MLLKIKQTYWNLLQRWSNWRRPTYTVLTPHSVLDTIAELTQTDKRRIIIDGGAHDGVVAHDFANKLGDVEIHAFEPNTDLLDKLRSNLINIPGSIQPFALAEQTESRTFHINASAMTSSLLQRGEVGEQYFNAVTEPKEKRTIDSISIDEYCEKQGIEHIDILKLDLQGYELHALRGASRMLTRGIGCIYTEISFGEIYRGGAQFSEIDQYLRRAGYKLYNLYNLSTRNSDGYLLGGDALYIPCRNNHEQNIRKAA